MPADRDRDRPVEIIAVELGFVTSAALAEARKDRESAGSGSLGRWLVEKQLLGGEESALLEAIVEKHLQRHGNELQTCLAAIRPTGDRHPHARLPITEAIPQNSIPPTLRTELAAGAAADAHPSSDEHATLIPAPEAQSLPDLPPIPARRFRILRHHASGGLGRVFVAYDEELKREVALKKIHARYAHPADCRARFLLEAEVTGQLEHPGVVPVYGMGEYTNGRPYYAMRFIRGESLRDAIQTFHNSRFGRTLVCWPSRRSAGHAGNC